MKNLLICPFVTVKVQPFGLINGCLNSAVSNKNAKAFL